MLIRFYKFGFYGDVVQVFFGLIAIVNVFILDTTDWSAN